MANDVSITKVVSRQFAENTYIAHLSGRGECIVVDPGLDFERIIATIEQQRLIPAAILVTHGHFDHIAGNDALKRCWPDCPIVAGRNELDKLSDPVANHGKRFNILVKSPPADVILDHGDVYEIAGFTFQIREIPGHSSGHIVFIWQDHTPPIVFGGDVLFAGSVGRTDFPGGSFEQLAAGIHEHLFTLPDETVVLSGHGEATTIGEEREFNPFVGKLADR